MIVMIKSAPDTPEGRRGLAIAQDVSADVVLLQNGTYFLGRDALRGFNNVAYVLEDDMKLRGLKRDGTTAQYKTITYDGLVDLMEETDGVLGMF